MLPNRGNMYLSNMETSHYNDHMANVIQCISEEAESLSNASYSR